MKKSRNKYDTSFKTVVITEFLRGASARELSLKYGVKERTIYAWSKSANDYISVTPKSALNTYLDKGYQELIKSLEERIVKIENELNLIKKIEQKNF